MKFVAAELVVASEVGEEGAGEDFAEEGEPDDAGFEDAVIAIGWYGEEEFFGASETAL